jgi:hypothetical protein
MPLKALTHTLTCGIINRHPHPHPHKQPPTIKTEAKRSNSFTKKLRFLQSHHHKERSPTQNRDRSVVPTDNNGNEYTIEDRDLVRTHTGSSIILTMNEDSVPDYFCERAATSCPDLSCYESACPRELSEKRINHPLRFDTSLSPGFGLA